MSRPVKPHHVEIYCDHAGRWRWRAVSRNGKIVGQSEQGYVRRSYCRQRAVLSFPDVPLRVLT